MNSSDGDEFETLGGKIKRRRARGTSPAARLSLHQQPSAHNKPVIVISSLLRAYQSPKLIFAPLIDTYGHLGHRVPTTERPSPVPVPADRSSGCARHLLPSPRPSSSTQSIQPCRPREPANRSSARVSCARFCSRRRTLSTTDARTARRSWTCVAAPSASSSARRQSTTA